MITLHNLSKTYGAQEIFQDVNFTFPSHGLICLLGPSGCGKSTLLNMLAGFDNEYHGSIEIAGTNITTMDRSALCTYRKDNLGFIFQDYNLLSGYSVLENILMASVLHEGDKLSQITKAEDLLKQLGLFAKRHEKVEHLSGGQKQRVAIIRALMNDPSIILADEPTGSLDRKNANEIMDILKRIAKDCLIIVITHDKKICDYSEAILHIENKQISGRLPIESFTQKQLRQCQKIAIPTHKIAWKNFIVHRKSYICVSFVIALGILTVLLSLSSGNILQSSIHDFKEKNTAFNNGYIKADQDIDKTKTLLQEDKRIEHIYDQYVIKQVSLKVNDQTTVLAEKYPMAKATQQMSYGRMPNRGDKEITLSPSLAKKFDSNIANLVGKELRLTYLGNNEVLTISGIFNAGYDDFYVSSDFEETLYENDKELQVYALSYDVKEFEDIVSVAEMLSNNNIQATTLADEVASLQNTFTNLQRLFMMISILIVCVSMFLSIVLLVKLQNTRYREVGLLSALGFDHSNIRSILFYEHVFLSFLATCFNLSILLVMYICSFYLSFEISFLQVALSICGSTLLVSLIGMFTSRNLLSIEPAKALRK